MKQKLSFLKVGIATFFSLLISTTYSNTIIVTNINDSGAGSLRDAVSTSIDGDTIRFDPSLISPAGTTIILQSEIAFSKSLVFKGLYNSTDTLYISGDNTCRIFNITNAGKIVLDSLVIVNGNAGFMSNGGAITIDNCTDTLHVRNSIITKCAGDRGGAIYSYIFSTSTSAIAAIEVINSKITNNTANGMSGYGGGIYITAQSLNNFAAIYVNIFGSEISANVAQSIGGIFSDCSVLSGLFPAKSTIKINNSTINNNSGTSGSIRGAAYFNTYSPSYWGTTDLEIIGTTITGNNDAGVNAQTQGAGSLIDSTYCKITASNSNISNNSAGVGIQANVNQGNSLMNIFNCNISYNKGGVSGNVSGKYSVIDISGSTISNNKSSNSGSGGVGAVNSTVNGIGVPASSKVNIKNSNLSNNKTYDNTAGVYSHAFSTGNSAISRVNLHKSIVENDTTLSGFSSGRGAGIYSYSHAPGSLSTDSCVAAITLDSSSVSFNYSPGSGTGLYAEANASSVAGAFAIVDIKHSSVNGNSMSTNGMGSGNGGAIYTNAYSSSKSISDINVFNSEISDNSAYIDGGAIYGYSFCYGTDTAMSTIDILHSTLSGNNAANGSGGGIYSFASSPSGPQEKSQVNITTSTLYNNKAHSDGAAVYSKAISPSNSFSVIDITNSTIYKNIASQIGYMGASLGGAIFSNANNSSSIIVKSSIAAQNGNKAFINNQSPTINSGGYNVFSDTTIIGSIATDTLQVDSTLLNLGPLQNNGGSTRTLLPGAGSIAIDFGNPMDNSNAQNGPIARTRDAGAAEILCSVDVSVTNNSPTLTANSIGASYQWIDCATNTAITGETGQSYTPTVNGSYKVEISNNGCVDTSVCYSVLNIGIKENNENNIVIFPNPASSKVNITNNVNETYSVNICNLSGKSILTLEEQQGTSVIDVSSYQKGMYFITVKSKEKLKIIKFIVL